MLAELVEDDESLLYMFEGDEDYGTDIDIAEMLKRLEWHYRNTRKKSPVETGYVKALFRSRMRRDTPRTGGDRRERKDPFKGMSLFDGKVGEKVFSDKTR
jgi:hypothetical protein